MENSFISQILLAFVSAWPPQISDKPFHNAVESTQPTRISPRATVGSASAGVVDDKYAFCSAHTIYSGSDNEK